MAKKSLETGEDIDSIPESMRAYLVMQAMESGKGIGTAFLGRTGLGPSNAGGMPWGIDNGSHGKVGMYSHNHDKPAEKKKIITNTPSSSHHTSPLPVAQHWPLDTRLTGHHGPHHFLLCRKIDNDILH